MVEEWQKKRYYRTRVLIDTADVLTPSYSGILVCLEPAELAMLRQLTQYLHRRSTFASDYDDAYYVAPSESDWDDIQAIVAELEDKLMSGCEDIVTALEAIEVQLACLCANATNPPLAEPGPAYDAVIEELLDDGTLAVQDPYGTTVPADGDRCALAQLTYAFMFEFMDETVIPTEKVLVDILLPLAVGAVGSAIGTPLLGVPVAAITAVLIALGDLAADNELANLRNALFANKEELVCAMYNGLATSYEQAHNDAAAVVEEMESLGFTDKLIVRALLAPYAMKACKTVYDAETSWATSNVTAGYCDDCPPPGFPYEWVQTMPPCPGVWTPTTPCTGDGYLGVSGNGSTYRTSTEFTLPSIAVDVDLNIEVQYKSKFGSGWTVGYCVLQYESAEDTWTPLKTLTCTTTETAGTINIDTEDFLNFTVPVNSLRVELHGQVPQGDADPWPFEVAHVHLTFTIAE